MEAERRNLLLDLKVIPEPEKYISAVNPKRSTRISPAFCSSLPG
jgi:hypothetical protein